MTCRRRRCRSCKISIYTPGQSLPRLLFVRQAGCGLPGMMSILFHPVRPSSSSHYPYRARFRQSSDQFPQPFRSSFPPLLSFLVLSHSRLLSFNSTYLWGKSSNPLSCPVLSSESSSAPKEGSRWAL
ncbi:hypothetical protein CKAH01_02781 [Colletotrichum kahawae]|uniref:Uncharacterized protein n=1 Tax=Colletotrichum kahawae TaxID=34407 RepID=A0AAE0CX30_COLKA|nr:hypothetical protein CKAH01_02781 [Colletotrichum kahawae]